MPFSPRRFLRTLLHTLYGFYALAAFLVTGLIALMLVWLPLGIAARRQLAHLSARAFFRLALMPVRLSGAQNLPAAACVVVANHASYLDGVVLKAALPARFSFVIKKEISRVPLAGLLLRRIGSEFVDRFNHQAGAVDARRLLKAADAGHSLAFFPEGTFVARPGLGKFHSGAFAIAARAGLPVVPISIRGTRHILPSGRFLPRPGRIDIQVLQSLDPSQDAESGAAVIATREQARARILGALDEPDLSQIDGGATIQAQR